MNAAWRAGRDPIVPVAAEGLDLTPWRWARPVAVLLIGAMIGVYWLFSSAGIAEAG